MDQHFCPLRGEDVQRIRILRAVTDLTAERGVRNVSVSAVIARAQISRNAFTARFEEGVERCLIEILSDATQTVTDLVSETFAREPPGQDAMGAALAAVLSYFDSDRAIAHVCLVETLVGSERLFAERERFISTFRDAIVRQIDIEWTEERILTADGLLASTMGLARRSLLASPSQPLVSLVGPVMGFLGSPLAAKDMTGSQITRDEDASTTLLRSQSRRSRRRSAAPGRMLPSTPAFLADPRAFRARACLAYTASHPGASNAGIAKALGVHHHGQICSLLARLSEAGLLRKVPGRPGQANAWHATEVGLDVAHAMRGSERASGDERGKPPEGGSHATDMPRLEQKVFTYLARSR
jgi:AcrR family transcriptional regulator